ncbi:acylphosphatase [Niabella terrae]
MSLQTRHIIVTGKVQGVYFRQSARKTALALGLTGTVENLPDGRVRILATGSPAALEQFLEWCRQGPVMARVASVEYQETDLQPYEHFSIL